MLRRKISERDLKLLHREIGLMVSDYVDQRVMSQNEERQGWGSGDGCTSAGCISYLRDGGPGMQEFLNDVKAYVYSTS